MPDPEWDAHCADFAIRNLPWRREKAIRAKIAKMPRTPAELADLYRKFGVTSLKALIDKLMGPSIDPKRAMRGDLVMVDNALGICRGELVEFMDRMQPIGRASAAWPTNRRKFG